MAPRHQIDLNGVMAPLCLLQMKNALNRLAPGELLKVMVHDADLVGSIATILSRSADRIVDQREQDGLISLFIRKG